MLVVDSILIHFAFYWVQDGDTMILNSVSACVDDVLLFSNNITPFCCVLYSKMCISNNIHDIWLNAGRQIAGQRDIKIIYLKVHMYVTFFVNAIVEDKSTLSALVFVI